MLKNLIIIGITFYQKHLSLPLKMLLGQPKFCYQIPSCSEYAKESVAEKGVIIGLMMALKQITSCRPQFI